MSFSSRRRNYLLMPHRRDALIEWYVLKKRNERPGLLTYANIANV